jgi:hypothetical protein|tara:strand:- start:214 stop:462 length:249 start_codon:yes stop_codon:yes gene_type:complete
MEAPNPTPPSQRRNKIAQLERDNRECSRKIEVLREIIEGLSHSINDAVDTIALHEHNDNALMILEADLTELLDVTNEQLIAL